MLKKSCFSIALLGCLSATALGQNYHSPNDTLPEGINVSFARAQAKDDSDSDSDSANAEKETIAALRDQLKRMELRLEELEVDVEKKVAATKKVDKSTVKESKDVDKRLKDLEKSFEKQEKTVEKHNTKLSSVVTSSVKNKGLQIFGRVHIDYWAFPDADEGIETLEGGDPQDRVNFRRLRIGVKGDINDNVFYKYEGEFAGGADPSYRDAFIGVRDLPLFNTVIIGNHKRPYGLDHLNSSRYNVFIERPSIVEAFNQDARRLGISSNGQSDDQAWNWRYGLFHQNLTQTTDGFASDHYQPELAGRIANTAWYDETSGGRGYFHWAVSGSYGQPDGGAPDNAARFRTRPEARSDARWLDTGRIAGATESTLLGLETVFNVGAFQLTAEYLQANVERTPSIGRDVNFGGGYIQVAYFLTGEHTPWNRKTGTLGRVKPYENFFSVRDGKGNRGYGLGAWQVAARYSYADLQDEDIIGGKGESLTLGLNWWWNQNARMQLNYIAGEIEREPIASGQYQIIGLRWMVDF